jgi:ribosomal protein L7/L12
MEWGLVALGVVVAVAVVGSYLDTKARIARIEHKLNVLLRHSGIDTGHGSALSERVKDLARDPARKIEAIKTYREETGAGLAEAKTAVEAYIHGL